MTLETLVLHPRSRASLERFLAAPGHSLLLLGPSGAGKFTLAQTLTANVLEADSKQLAHEPYYLLIEPVKGTISIEKIREAQEFVRLKTTGTAKLRRAVVIIDAHLMTIEAQNAFLKLLEEPPSDTIIVMTAVSKESLLPTIVSRTQRIQLLPVDQQAVATHFTQKGHPSDVITRAYHMSNGQPGMMTDILSSTSEDSLIQFIDEAKKVFTMTPFERVSYVDSLAKRKDDIPNFLWAMERVADVSLTQASKQNNTQKIEHLIAVVKTIIQARNALKYNAAPKLLLTNLMLSL